MAMNLDSEVAGVANYLLSLEHLSEVFWELPWVRWLVSWDHFGGVFGGGTGCGTKGT